MTCGRSAHPGPAQHTQQFLVGPDQVRQVELDPAIHLRVTILLAGTGNRGVALLPQAGGDVCQLADFGHHLADNGYRVATFGPWSSPNERPATAAYDALIAAGAERAVVLGASQGATVALANAAALSPAPAGVITLSADGDALVGAPPIPARCCSPGPRTTCTPRAA